MAFCEIEKYPQQILKKHWPDVPIFDDIRKLHATDLPETIDVICGGPPCQPFSTASHGKKTAVDMFPEYFRIISEVTPKYVISENVIKQPIDKLSKGLEKIGYKSERIKISAGDIGADHERVRWWLCSYSDNKGKLYGKIHAEMARMQKICKSVWSWENYTRTLRISDGISNRLYSTARIKSVGNSVVPQIPELIGSAIMEIEEMMND